MLPGLTKMPVKALGEPEMLTTDRSVPRGHTG